MSISSCITQATRLSRDLSRDIKRSSGAATASAATSVLNGVCQTVTVARRISVSASKPDIPARLPIEWSSLCSTSRPGGSQVEMSGQTSPALAKADGPDKSRTPALRLPGRGHAAGQQCGWTACRQGLLPPSGGDDHALASAGPPTDQRSAPGSNARPHRPHDLEDTLACGRASSRQVMVHSEGTSAAARASSEPPARTVLLTG
jgi:hypothetical protein